MLLLEMDIGDIVSSYYHLYPTLLIYGAPVIPVADIFEGVAPEQWGEILSDFSELIRLIANDRQIEDTLETSDIFVFQAASMFHASISMAKKSQLPSVVNSLLGNTEQSGGGKFDFYKAFESQEGGGEDDLVAAGTGLLARALLPNRLTVSGMIEEGITYANGAQVVAEARAAVKNFAELVELRDQAALIEAMSDKGEYSQANLSSIINELHDRIKADIAKLRKFKSSMSRANFNINNLEKKKSVFGKSAVNFSNIKGNPRLTRIVTSIDAMFKKNPLISKLEGARVERQRVSNELFIKIRDRFISIGVITAASILTIKELSRPVQEEPVRQTSTGSPMGSPTPSPIVQAATMAVSRTWGDWVEGGITSGFSTVTSTTGRVLGAAVKGTAQGIGSATGITDAISSVQSGAMSTVNFLKSYCSNLRNAAGMIALGGGAVIGLPVILSYTSARSDVASLARTEEKVLERFNNILANMLISRYEAHVTKTFVDFSKYLSNRETRESFVQVIRSSGSIEKLFERIESQWATKLDETSFNSLTLLMEQNVYTNFIRELDGLMKDNAEITKMIISNHIEKLQEADRSTEAIARIPLNALSGVGALLGGVAIVSGSLATRGLAIAASGATRGVAAASSIMRRNAPANQLARAVATDELLPPQNIPAAAADLTGNLLAEAMGAAGPVTLAGRNNALRLENSRNALRLRNANREGGGKTRKRRPRNRKLSRRR